MNLLLREVLSFSQISSKFNRLGHFKKAELFRVEKLIFAIANGMKLFFIMFRLFFLMNPIVQYWPEDPVHNSSRFFFLHKTHSDAISIAGTFYGENSFKISCHSSDSTTFTNKIQKKSGTVRVFLFRLKMNQRRGLWVMRQKTVP